MEDKQRFNNICGVNTDDKFNRERLLVDSDKRLY